MLVHGESSEGGVMAYWIAVKSVRTPRDELLAAADAVSGCTLSYYRLGLEPAAVPPPDFLDALHKITVSASPGSALMFNCMTGYTRSAFAMNVATLQVCPASAHPE